MFALLSDDYHQKWLCLHYILNIDLDQIQFINIILHIPRIINLSMKITCTENNLQLKYEIIVWEKNVTKCPDYQMHWSMTYID